MSEDYAGGSYKSNAELESDVDELKAEIAKQGKAISSLTADIQALRKLILDFVELGPNNGVEVRGWEVSNLLVNWADPDNAEDGD